MLLRGLMIVVGPMQIRGLVHVRVLKFDYETIWKTLAWFGPPALLVAVICRFLAEANQHLAWSDVLLYVHVALLDS
jgi:hypothetical protein